jgi:hypothetical protein
VLTVATRSGIPLGAVGSGAIVLPEDVARGLAGAAKLRCISVEVLAIVLLRAVTCDGLVEGP